MGHCADCGKKIEPRSGKGRPFIRCPSCREGRKRLSQALITKVSACADCGTSITVVRTDQTKHLRAPTRCSECKTTANRQKSYRWREANPEQWKAVQDRSSAKRLADPEHRRLKREGMILRTYGISPEEFATLIAEQDGKCAICREPPNGKANGRARSGHLPSLHVDHDHDTGKIRGLLCGPCNTGLGLFRDEPRLLLAAIKYLQKG